MWLRGFGGVGASEFPRKMGSQMSHFYTSCVDCGKKVTYKTKPPRRCPKCQTENKKEVYEEYQRWKKAHPGEKKINFSHCLDCGQVFPWHKSHPKRCSSCRRIHNKYRNIKDKAFVGTFNPHKYFRTKKTAAGPRIFGKIILEKWKRKQSR